MSKFAKTMLAIGVGIMVLLVCVAAALVAPSAKAADPEPGISTQMSQDGAASISKGALVGWNGWEYTPEGATVPVKVNFVENEDGSGTWHSLTEEGIDGKTSGTISKDEVGKTIVKVEDGASSLVDNVTYKNLNTSQEYTLIGNLAAKFADGSYGIILSVNRKDAAPATQADDDAAGTDEGTDGTDDGSGTDEGTEGTDDGSGTDEGTGDDDNAGDGNDPAGDENDPAGDENGGDDDNGDGTDDENGEGDAADKESADLGTITYYNPVDKKVYSRPIANGKADPVEVKDAKVTLDEESGMPMEAISSAVKFVPSSSSGSVKNVFSGFDATDMWEWTFVAFERLYAGDPVDESGEGSGGNADEGSDPGSGDVDENGNTTKMVVDGTLANVLVALADDDASAASITAYDFEDLEPLNEESDPTLTDALANWQTSMNQGLKAAASETDPQDTLVIYTDPDHEAEGTLSGNEMYLAPDSSRLSGLANGKVIIWTDDGGTNPVDALVSTATVSKDDVDYTTYTLTRYPAETDDVSLSQNRIGNYGMVNINGKPYQFELTGIQVNGTSTEYSYNIYSFTESKYDTETTNAPYANALGNVYLDKASRLDAVNALTPKTLAYDANLTDADEPAPTPVPVPVTIAFDANGGTPTPATLNGNAGEAIENQTIETVTREGYVFAGWWTENGSDDGEWGTLASAQNEDGTYNIKIAVYPDQSVTYYARWNAEGTVTITFESDGKILKELSGTEGATIEDATIPEPEAREGYAFDGWWTKDGTDGDWGEGLEKEDGKYVLPYSTFPAASVTYYAKWIADSPADDPSDEPKTGLVASHEDPNDLAQSIFFMSVEEAAAAAADYSPSNGSDGSAMDGMMSQMGDAFGWMLGVGAFAACAAGGIYLIRRGRE